LGLGESGCGNSTTGGCILHLFAPTSGELWFAGENATACDPHALRALRRDKQIIFRRIVEIASRAISMRTRSIPIPGPYTGALYRGPIPRPYTEALYRGPEALFSAVPEPQAHHAAGRRRKPNRSAARLPRPHALSDPAVAAVRG